MNKQSSDSNEILVSIHCLVYNHEPYIRECLEGFVMQKTNFPFEAIVHDDASTDKSADIIREYAEKYPHIIKPIYQTENQYSKGNGRLDRIMEANLRGKYVALCEGDDYWTDPLKLQKQVDFLEAHPDYSMVCCEADILTSSGMTSRYHYYQSCEMPIKDLILKGGGWIHTASIMYRRELKNDYPNFARMCHVGDYPLCLHMAMRGRVYFMSDKMVVYRSLSIGSWTSRTIVDENYFNRWLSELRILQGYNEYSNYQYDKIFKQRISRFVIFFLRQVPSLKKKLLQEVPDFPKWLTWQDRIRWWRLLLGINGLGRKIKLYIKKLTEKN